MPNKSHTPMPVSNRREPQVTQTHSGPLSNDELTYGGPGRALRMQDTHGNAFVQDFVRSKARDDRQRSSPNPRPVPVGTLDYYELRNKDFVRRHPDLKPPFYYMDYGNYYARLFKTELRPQLSEVGQQWVDRAFVLLQQKIEQRRSADQDTFDQLERDPSGFKDFAFGTHAPSYIEAGIQNLPYHDLWLILKTPRNRDLWSWGGIVEFAEVVPWGIYDLAVPSAY